MMRIVRSIVTTLVFTFCLLGPLAGIGRADTLYGITLSNQLITIDPTTGAGTLIGSLDSPMAPYGLAASGGKLYTYDQSADLIRQIDPNTGHTLASFSIGAGNLFGEGELTFRSDGIGFLSTSGGAGVSILSLNLATSSSSNISNEPFFFDGLAFNNADVLYGMSQAQFGDGVSKLYTISQTTGGLSLLGSLNISAANTEILGGLTFRSNGTLFAALSDQSTSTFATVNPATGQATAIGTITGFGDVSGIAFLTPAVNEVPEPGTFVLMGTAIVGLVTFRAAGKKP